MKLLIPMAGAGQRFQDAGYAEHKPAIQTIDHRSGAQLPMVVCATLDLPGLLADGSNVIYVDRDFHRTDGVEEAILAHFPKAQFITVEKLTEGQASTCLLARPHIDNDEALLIAGCDNGMIYDAALFDRETQAADVLVFTYRNDPCVLANPSAHGWVAVDGENNIQRVSVKKALSDTPMRDHAIVATFWFRHGHDFVRLAERMIAENDRINGEFYVDQVIAHALAAGLRCKAFEIDRYLGWGTPADYENYMNTWRYWDRFLKDPRYPF